MPKVPKYTCQDLVEDNLLCDNGLTCGKGFVRKGDLTRHRRIHTGIMSYLCYFCGKGFQQKTQLRNHENTHTGNAPHECDICFEKFKDPSSCCRHRKEQHEGDYMCFVDGCDKTIARKCNFRRHLQRHRAYHPDMELEVYWVRRNFPGSKRFDDRSRAKRKPVITKVESPPPMLLKSEVHEECFEPIKIPQLYTTEPPSHYREPYIGSIPLPDVLPTTTQSHEVYHLHSDMKPELQGWRNFIDAQNSQCYSSPSLTTPSLSSSLSSSPESSHLPLGSSTQPHTYQQLQPYALQLQPISDTRAPSPMSWVEAPLTDHHQMLSLPIERPDPSQSNTFFSLFSYIQSSERYSC